MAVYLETENIDNGQLGKKVKILLKESDDQGEILLGELEIHIPVYWLESYGPNAVSLVCSDGTASDVIIGRM